MSHTAARRADLDIAKGIGIYLVVFGHIVAKVQSQGNLWYNIAQAAVYTFHMPFFLYLSGYVAFLTGAARATPAQWPSLARRRAERLLVPFLLFGCVLVAAKFAAAQFMYVDNLPDAPLTAAINLVWNTDASPAISIWYMFIIFVAALLTPALLWVCRGNTLLLLGIALVLFAVGLPHRMFADRVAAYYLFFVLGGLAADAGERWLNWIDRWGLACCAALVAVIVAEFMRPSFDMYWSHLWCGVIALPALHSLARRLPFSRSQVLQMLGAFSFAIYLFNTLFIGLAKGILLHFVPWDGPGFLVHMPVLLLAGLALPIVLKQTVLRRFPALDRLTT